MGLKKTTTPAIDDAPAIDGAQQDGAQQDEPTAAGDMIIITGTGHRHTVRAGEVIPAELRAVVSGGRG